MTEETSAITQLRSELLLRLTELSGDVRLILQRMDHADQRTEEHRTALARLDERVDAVERTTITRAELDARDERMRSELAEEARRRLMLWGLVVTIAMGLLGAGVGALGLLIR